MDNRFPKNNSINMNAIEGDFVETYEGLIFDVKGLLHPRDRIIAFIRYIPFDFFIDRYFKYLKSSLKCISDTQNSQFKKWNIALTELNTIKDEFLKRGNFSYIIEFIETHFNFTIDSIREKEDGHFYIKVYDMRTRYDLLTILKPDYIFIPENYDFPLQAVLKCDVKRIHKPEGFLQYARKKWESNKDSSVYGNLLELVKFLCKLGNISEKVIGLSGSTMVNLQVKKIKINQKEAQDRDSDFDLVIYGEENSRKLHSNLDSFFSSSTFPFSVNDNLTIDIYDEERLKEHFDFRGKGFKIDLDHFIQVEKRKSHQFFANNNEVFIRFLKYTRKTNPNLRDFDKIKFQTIGRIEVEAEIIDDTDSFFTPAIYLAYIHKIKDLKSEVDDQNVEEKEKEKVKEKEKEKEDFKFKIEHHYKNQIEIFTLRGRFIENAKLGERVTICGKLEKVILTNEDISYRIILGIDNKDIFILN